jgi:RNA polymerase sigma-70 factor (ECF subfamily)
VTGEGGCDALPYSPAMGSAEATGFRSGDTGIRILAELLFGAMDGADLEALLLRARSGDREAQGAICERFGRRVRGAIHGRLGRDLRARVDTADVFQSTMLASLTDLGAMEFRGEEDFVAWLAQIAERRLIDATRRHRAQGRDVARQAPLDVAALVPESLTSPSQALVRDEAERDVRAAVARLPEVERRVVELRSFEGLGYLEIAERLGLPDRHVARNAFLRALKRMGDLLDGEAQPTES